MASAYTRKKQPDVVRRDLLDHAIALAAEHGLAALSLQRIAASAGVTKGGLLHHFADKQALVDAVFDVLMTQFVVAMEQAMANDPEPYGRFTRAYLDLACVDAAEPDDSRALWASILADQRLSHRWGAWLTAQLAALGEQESSTVLEAVRFAADGLWAGLFTDTRPRDRLALRDCLRELTYPPTKAGS